MDEFTVVPGYVDGFTLLGTWYYYKIGSLNIPEFAPFVDGWIEIEINDGSYTVTVDVYDDLNNDITGTFTYAVPASVSSVYGLSYPVLSL